MAKISIKSLDGIEQYSVEIDDTFVQKAKDMKELQSFVSKIIELIDAQLKQKSLEILEKQTDCVANKITMILNGITETIKVIQKGNIFSVKSDNNFIKNYTWTEEKDVHL